MHEPFKIVKPYIYAVIPHKKVIHVYFDESDRKAASYWCRSTYVATYLRSHNTKENILKEKEMVRSEYYIASASRRGNTSWSSFACPSYLVVVSSELRTKQRMKLMNKDVFGLFSNFQKLDWYIPYRNKTCSSWPAMLCHWIYWCFDDAVGPVGECKGMLGTLLNKWHAWHVVKQWHARSG